MLRENGTVYRVEGVQRYFKTWEQAELVKIGRRLQEECDRIERPSWKQVAGISDDLMVLVMRIEGAPPAPKRGPGRPRKVTP